MNDYYLVRSTISKILCYSSCVTNFSDICKMIIAWYPPDYCGNISMRTRVSEIYNELCILCLKYTSCHKTICGDKREGILLYDYIYQAHFIFERF